jgi:hypothetical protein
MPGRVLGRSLARTKVFALVKGDTTCVTSREAEAGVCWMQVEVASEGFILVRKRLRLVRTEFFRTLVDAVKEIAEATARAITVDINKPRIAAGNSDDLLIFELGLDEVAKSCRRKNLLFFTEVKRHVAEADIGCVSVNTSTDTEVGAADVNKEPKVPTKVKYEEV